MSNYFNERIQNILLESYKSSFDKLQKDFLKDDTRMQILLQNGKKLSQEINTQIEKGSFFFKQENELSNLLMSLSYLMNGCYAQLQNSTVSDIITNRIVFFPHSQNFLYQSNQAA